MCFNDHNSFTGLHTHVPSANSSDYNRIFLRFQDESVRAIVDETSVII